MTVTLPQGIPNIEELSIKALQKLLKNPGRYPEVFGLMGRRKLRELSFASTIDEIHEISPMVAEAIVEKAEAKVMRKRIDSQRKFINKGSNRRRYLPTALLEHREAQDKEGNIITRFMGGIELASAGLVPAMQAHYHGHTKLPVAVSMVNMLPPDDDLGMKHRPISQIHMDNMNDIGMTVSGERVAWMREAPGYKWVEKCFPKAIDYRSYNHSLKAPLIPSGYYPEVEVTLTNLFVSKPVGVMPEVVVAEMQTLTVDDIFAELIRGMKSYRTTYVNDEGEKKTRRYDHKRLLRHDAEYLHEVCAEGDFVDILEAFGAYDLAYMLEGKGRLFMEAPADDDGSGRIHPDHPVAQQIAAVYGYVPVQVRAMDVLGIFAKGILVFDETALDKEGNPAILFSWKQIKGKWKGIAAKRSAAGREVKVKLHIGLLRAWDRRRYMSGCFELFENIGVVSDDPEVQKMISEMILADAHSLVDDYMRDLGKDGIHGLLGAIAKDDESVALRCKLIAKAHEADIKFDPMQDNRLREAMDQKLQRRLWSVAQGGGIKGLQEVIVIDASLNPGECISAAYRPGMEIAAYRFPMVLAQGLKVLRVVTPRPHNIVRGAVPANTIYMNPADVLDMQGDDDGDIVATTADERVLRLFNCKVDEKKYAIEPLGEKLDYTTGCKAGIDYIRGTPMGPVGIMTIHRAKLLAVGDILGALAMAVMIQEAIDKAKRHVIWSDWTKAVRPESWKLIDGVYHLHYDGSENYLRDRCGDEVITVMGREEIAEPTDGEMPVRAISRWVSNRMRMYGCDTKDGQYPIGWRRQIGLKIIDGNEVEVPLNKRISPTLWRPARTKQEGYEGGNLVHEIHDRALVGWMEIEGEFKGEGHGDIRALLVELLKHNGIDITPEVMGWAEYRQVRTLAGITEYSDMMRKAMNMDSHNDDGTDNSAKFAAIDRAYELLHLRMEEYAGFAGIQGLVNIWWMETTPHWRWENDDGASGFTDDINDPVLQTCDTMYKVNNPNHAINAVTWTGSPVMRAIGIETDGDCDYLSIDVINKVAKMALTKDDAFEWLSKKIWANEAGMADHIRTHTRIKGKPMHDCAHCRDRLQTSVVRSIRKARRHSEKVFLGKICGVLNKAGKYSRPGAAAELGINVTEIMEMSPESLQNHLEMLEGAMTKKEKATRNLVRKAMRNQR